jgi:antitoxin-like ribbon-helix-helix protein
MTRPEREGKKQVSAFVTVEKWKTLRHLVTDTERTANDLIDEAITLLAEKYGTEPKQPTGKKTSQRKPSP